MKHRQAGCACDRCGAARRYSRAYRKARPEEQRERRHAQYLKQKADPGFRARQRTYQREHYRKVCRTPEGWARMRSAREGVEATAADLLALLARQKGRCAVTGRALDFALPGKHPLQPSIDHIIPRAEGGPDTIDNLRVVIWAVNAARGGSSKHDALIDTLFTKCGEKVAA